VTSQYEEFKDARRPIITVGQRENTATSIVDVGAGEAILRRNRKKIGRESYRPNEP